MFSKDAARGEAVARRIEAGAVCINDAQVNYTALELPMGGVEGERAWATATAPTASASTPTSRRC